MAARTDDKDITNAIAPAHGADVKENAVEYHIDPIEERRVRRRIDYFIMPAMVVVFFFEFLDKQTINYASVFGLSKTLNLTGQDFSWAVSIFYFAQFASQCPSAY